MKKVILLIINAWRLSFPLLIMRKINKERPDSLISDFRMNTNTNEKYSTMNYFLLLLKSRNYRSVFYERARHHNVNKILLSVSKVVLKTLPTCEYMVDNYMGDGIKIAHNSLVVHANSVGNNVTFGPFVVVGKSEQGRPNIGDNVTINSHAVVFGDIKLNNVIVGAGSVVNSSFENVICVGVPAKIMKQMKQ